MDKIRCEAFSELVGAPNIIALNIQKFFDQNFKNVEILAQTQSQNDRYITVIITFKGVRIDPGD